jgi:hypothetical protein
MKVASGIGALIDLGRSHPMPLPGGSTAPVAGFLREAGDNLFDRAACLNLP